MIHAKATYGLRGRRSWWGFESTSLTICDLTPTLDVLDELPEFLEVPSHLINRSNSWLSTGSSIMA